MGRLGTEGVRHVREMAELHGFNRLSLCDGISKDRELVQMAGMGGAAKC